MVCGEVSCGAALECMHALPEVTLHIVCRPTGVERCSNVCQPMERSLVRICPNTFSGIDSTSIVASVPSNTVLTQTRRCTQATVAVATLMHMQAPGQALLLLDVASQWLNDDASFSRHEQKGIKELFDTTKQKLDGIEDDL